MGLNRNREIERWQQTGVLIDYFCSLGIVFFGVILLAICLPDIVDKLP